MYLTKGGGFSGHFTGAGAIPEGAALLYNNRVSRLVISCVDTKETPHGSRRKQTIHVMQYVEQRWKGREISLHDVARIRSEQTCISPYHVLRSHLVG